MAANPDSAVAVAATKTWLGDALVDQVRDQLGGMVEVGIVEPTVQKAQHARRTLRADLVPHVLQARVAGAAYTRSNVGGGMVFSHSRNARTLRSVSNAPGISCSLVRLTIPKKNRETSAAAPRDTDSSHQASDAPAPAPSRRD